MITKLQEKLKTNANVPPLRIYVLWHPAFAGNGVLPEPVKPPDREPHSNVMELAEGVLRLFQRMGKDLRGGPGIQVEFRSLPHPHRTDNLPREIPEENADITLIVPLIDDNLMVDSAWNRWLKELSAKQRFVVQPVTLSNNANRWRVTTGKHAIRLLDSPIDKRPGELHRQLMIVCAKLLSGPASSDSHKAPKVFVSYHGEGGDKTQFDGLQIANELHESVKDDYHGLEAFFAHKSFGAGVNYEERIREEVEQGAAVISVFTSQYHERTWCRREVRWAREPRRITKGMDCWQITPLIVVNALSTNWSEIIQEFGGCQIVGWSAGNAMQILDRALIEAVAASYHRRWAEKLASNGRVVISWIPDFLSLLKLRAAGHLPDGSTVVYPGHGVTDSDRKFLEVALRSVIIRTYDEIKDS